LFEEHNKRPRHIKLTQTETTTDTSFSCEETNKDSSNTTYKYCCQKCNFTSSNKKDYTRHLSTTKHQTMTNETQIHQNYPLSYECECGKHYMYKRGLWNHKKKCTYNNDKYTNNKLTTSIDTNLIIDLLKDNKELREMMIKQNKLILDIVNKETIPINDSI